MKSVLTTELELAKALARAAGKAILEHYVEGIAVQFKGAGSADPVTAADKTANQLIVAGIAAAFPGDAILAEESPLSAERHRYQRLWCIDPLDGTQEFIEHNGQFSVMIGLAIDGAARLGVVYQPTTDVLSWGADGCAFSEHGGAVTPLLASRTAAPAQAVMMVSRSHRSKSVARVAESLGIARTEPLGSVGLKVVRIASAAADVYLSLSNKTCEWDACAPEAILHAAGGTMTDVLGEPLRYNKETPNTPRGLLASNGPLHAACVAAVRPLAREHGWSAG